MLLDLELEDGLNASVRIESGFCLGTEAMNEVGEGTGGMG